MGRRAATTTCAAVIHLAADAAVSVLVIIGFLVARTFGWLRIDPLAGIIGACVIAGWSYGLIRDTGAILLDRLRASSCFRIASNSRRRAALVFG
jgi:Co/Zn/Cd efflux system component